MNARTFNNCNGDADASVTPRSKALDYINGNTALPNGKSPQMFNISLSSSSLEERTISQLPLPYQYNGSPYKESYFDCQVEEACQNLPKDGLRISKVILVGDVAVGKTCLVTRFCNNFFDTNYKATIGVDFQVERFEILKLPFNLQIWDTAGQERFKSIASAYYRGAKVVILCFDFSNFYSLQSIPMWLEETLKCNDSPLLFLVGTKSDSVSKSAYTLTEVEALNLANNINAEYWPVSSKTGENVTEFFQRVAALTFSETILEELEVGDKAKISTNFVRISQISKTKPKRKTKCLSGCAQ